MGALRFLYKDIFNKLEEITLVNTVADYNGQYLEDEQENYNLVKYPAVYIETVETNWNKDFNSILDFDLEAQTGSAIIKLHIVHKTLHDRDKSLRDFYYKLVNVIASKIQRLEGGNNENGTYTTVLRTQTEEVIPSKLLTTILTYEVNLQDTFTTGEVLYEEEFIDFTIDTKMNTNPFDALQDVNSDFVIDKNGEFIFTTDIHTDFILP